MLGELLEREAFIKSHILNPYAPDLLFEVSTRPGESQMKVALPLLKNLGWTIERWTHPPKRAEWGYSIEHDGVSYGIYRSKKIEEKHR